MVEFIAQGVNKNDGVDYRTNKVTCMMRELPMIRTVMGGTRCMRDRASEYLPKYAAETAMDYNNRVKRSVFTNYFQLTIKHLVGKAFSKPLVLKDDVPASIKRMAEDIDLQGTHINDFAANLFSEVLSTGFASILVDYPVVVEGLNLQEERSLGARPYMLMVPIENLLGVRLDAYNNITMARLQEITEEESGTYGEKTVQRVRVLTPGNFELYAYNTDTKGYALESVGTMSPVKRVPLVPVYGKKEGAWLGLPPLIDLCFKNIQHYQTDSSLDNTLQTAAFPILAASGWSKDEDSKIVVGSNVVLATLDSSSRFYYVEHTGTAINAVKQRLDDLKADMATMGLQMLVPRADSGQATATENQIKYSEATSDLQRMAFSLQDSIENALQLMAEWIGEKSGGSVELKGQYVLPRDVATEVNALIALRNSREITSKTLLTELIRRDFLPEDFDVDSEIEAVQIDKEESLSNFQAAMGGKQGPENDPGKGGSEKE